MFINYYYKGSLSFYTKKYNEAKEFYVQAFNHGLQAVDPLIIFMDECIKSDEINREIKTLELEIEESKSKIKKSKIETYEDDDLVEKNSNKLLCSSNNYKCPGFIFNSFGDSNGLRKDLFRFFKLAQKSIDKAKEIFKGFKYFICTTKSHQKEKKGLVCDRFRIILPIINFPKTL